MKTRFIIACAAGALTLLAGGSIAQLARDAPAASALCAASAKPMARLELLFGTTRAGADAVGEKEWETFLDSEITPRFPDGLTVLHGNGQWRGSDGRITKESSVVLVVWYEPSSKSDSDIEAIRSAYKSRFNQESVMRVDSVSCVSF